MPIAKKSIASNPTDAIILNSDVTLEDVSLTFTVRYYTGLSDEIDVNVDKLTIGELESIAISDEIDIETNLFHFNLVSIGFYDSIDIEVSQNYTEQLKEFVVAAVIDNSDAVGRLDSIELDFAVSSINPGYFKEFSYLNGNLIGYSIYTDSGKSSKLFDIGFTFSGENLSEKTITRISDNKVLHVMFTYSGDSLISQNRIIT